MGVFADVEANNKKRKKEQTTIDPKNGLFAQVESGTWKPVQDTPSKNAASKVATTSKVATPQKNGILNQIGGAVSAVSSFNDKVGNTIKGAIGGVEKAVGLGPKDENKLPTGESLFPQNFKPGNTTTSALHLNKGTADNPSDTQQGLKLDYAHASDNYVNYPSFFTNPDYKPDTTNFSLDQEKNQAWAKFWSNPVDGVINATADFISGSPQVLQTLADAQNGIDKSLKAHPEVTKVLADYQMSLVNRFFTSGEKAITIGALGSSKQVQDLLNRSLPEAKNDAEAKAFFATDTVASLLGTLVTLRAGGEALSGIKVDPKILSAGLFTAIGQGALPAGTSLSTRAQTAVVDATSGLIASALPSGNQFEVLNKKALAVMGANALNLGTQSFTDAKLQGASDAEAGQAFVVGAAIGTLLFTTSSSVRGLQDRITASGKVTQDYRVLTPTDLRSAASATKDPRTASALTGLAKVAETEGKSVRIHADSLTYNKVAQFLGAENKGGISNIEFVEPAKGVTDGGFLKQNEHPEVDPKSARPVQDAVQDTLSTNGLDAPHAANLKTIVEESTTGMLKQYGGQEPVGADGKIAAAQVDHVFDDISGKAAIVLKLDQQAIKDKLTTAAANKSFSSFSDIQKLADSALADVKVETAIPKSIEDSAGKEPVAIIGVKEALNSGNIEQARNIYSQIPDDSPYKSTAKSLIDLSNKLGVTKPSTNIASKKGVILPEDVKPTQQYSSVDEITKAHKDADLKVTENASEIVVGKIVVPEAERGKGVGTTVMKEITDYADRTGKIVTLTPSDVYGGDKGRLVDFNKRFGFEQNTNDGQKGFGPNDEMIRYPKGYDEALATVKAVAATNADYPKTVSAFNKPLVSASGVSLEAAQKSGVPVESSPELGDVAVFEAPTDVAPSEDSFAIDGGNLDIADLPTAASRQSFLDDNNADTLAEAAENAGKDGFTVTNPDGTTTTGIVNTDKLNAIISSAKAPASTTAKASVAKGGQKGPSGGRGVKISTSVSRSPQEIISAATTSSTSGKGITISPQELVTVNNYLQESRAIGNQGTRGYIYLKPPGGGQALVLGYDKGKYILAPLSKGIPTGEIITSSKPIKKVEASDNKADIKDLIAKATKSLEAKQAVNGSVQPKVTKIAPGQFHPTTERYFDTTSELDEVPLSVEPIDLEAKPRKVRTAVKSGLNAMVQQEAAPGVVRTWESMQAIIGELLDSVSPTTRSEIAKETGNIFREKSAQMIRRQQVAMEQSSKRLKEFAKKSNEENLAFINDVENGVLDTPEKIEYRQRFDFAGQLVREVNPNFNPFIENYFSHMWEKPGQAAKVFLKPFKRPLQGSKSFLKQRTIPTYAKGIELGLKPITYNPEELLLTHEFQVWKYVMAHDVFNEMKDRKIAKFYRFGQDHGNMVKLDDSIASVYKSPMIPVDEYVDTKLYNGLQDFAKSLGIKHERVASVGRQGVPAGAIGVSFKGQSSVRTKTSTPMGVLAHEIGHALDDKFNITKAVINKSTKAELIKLADERVASLDDVSLKHKEYLHSEPELIANLVDAYVSARPLLERIAPKTLVAFQSFLETNPKLFRLTRIEAGLERTKIAGEINAGGMIRTGDYYAEPEAARVFNNYLSAGLAKSPTYRTARYFSNFVNSFQLGLSAFHAGFVSVDASISDFAIGIRRTATGDVVGGTKSMAKGLLLMSPATTYLRGRKLNKAYLNALSHDPLLNAFVAGGGRTHMDSIYKNNSLQEFKKNIREKKPFTAALSVPSTLVETFAMPLMEHIVPMMKLGVFAEIAEFELSRNQDMSQLELRNVMGSAWDSVDNRMGQLAYDNLFWNKALKDIGLISVRSLGWNLGTYREVGGGLVDTVRQFNNAAHGKGFKLTNRMAYILAMVGVLAFYGAVYFYLHNGKGPEDLKDYIFPKTGRKLPNGKDERVSLPSYAKDIYEYWEAPLTTLEHKTNPLFSILTDMLNNTDFYGTQIRNEDDSTFQQAAQLFSYAFTSLAPFSFRASTPGQLAPDATRRIEQFFGIAKAPASVNQTKGEAAISSIFDQRPTYTTTKEQADKNAAKQKARNDLQAGKTVDFKQLVKDGVLTEKGVKTFIADSKLTSLQRSFGALTTVEQKKVWDDLSDKEKNEVKDQLHKDAKGLLQQ